MAIENLYPTIKPSLNLDFANTKTLDPRITFSRTSEATYYDGKTVAKAEENLLLYSQDFVSGWNKGRVTVTADQAVAPDGTNTADKIVETTEGTSHVVFQMGLNANVTYAFSVYCKANGRSVVGISNSSNGVGRAQFNISTGAVLPSATGAVIIASPAITSVGDGWYRISCIITSPIASSIAIFLQDSDTTISYTGDGVSGIYIWGAQLEQRSQVTAYTPTTTKAITKYQPVLRTAVAGAPRFDHDPLTGESLGLLVEEQRTNLFLNSRNLSGANFVYINKNENVLVAPDGTQTGTLVFGAGQDAVSGANTNINASATATTMTASVYVKVFPDDTAFNLVFLMRNDTTGTNFSSGLWNTATNTISGGWAIKSIGNDWYRVSYTNTTAQIINTGNNIRLYFGATGGSKLNKDLRWGVWGAQLEAGAFPTSYIRTEASQVTRAADNVTMTGENFSSWYRADEGTLFAEASSYRAAYSGTAVIWDGTSANRIDLSIPGTSRGVSKRFTIFVNGAATADFLPTATVVPSTFYRGVGAYKVNDIGAYSTDSTITTDNSSAVPVVNRLSIGGRLGGSEYQNGHIKRIAYYPKRLSNNNLAALTA